MINEKQEELDALAAKQEAFDKEFEMQKEVAYQRLACSWALLPTY